MVTVVTRAANGIPLTHDQVDSNFTGLADAVNNIGEDILIPAIAAKDAAEASATSAQLSATSAAGSANAASLSQGGAASSAEQAADSAAESAAYVDSLQPTSGASKVGAVDGSGGTLFTTVAGFIARVLSSAGSSLIGFLQYGVGAIRRSMESKARETVTLEDFDETVGSGTVNASPAMLKALAVWAANPNTEIKLVGSYRLDDTIPVANLETRNPEVRLKFTGGGTLIKNNAGFMFDKPAGQTLQTGHIFFDGVRFQGANLSGQTFILNGDNIIRTHFIGCFGTGINIAKAAGYLQTIYCTDTTWRKWGGYLFDCNYLFDINWHGVAEAGDGFLITRDASAEPACNSLHISGDIEGLTGVSGPAINTGTCRASSITKLYCEGNAGGDIDCSRGIGYHIGLVIASCGFQPHGDKLSDPNYYSVVTGKGAADSIVLMGNTSTHNLFDVTAGNQSAIIDTGNSVAAGKKKFSPTSNRLFSISGQTFTASLVPGLGAFMDAYTSSFGYENTRGTVGGESVASLTTYGPVNPATSPSSYVQVNWQKGSIVFNSVPFVAARQYGTGVVHDALIFGWVCETAGAPGAWREIPILLPY